jgi:hypothetical protein
LAEHLDSLNDDLRKQAPGGLFQWPEVEAVCGLHQRAIAAAMRHGLSDAQAKALDALLWMSGREVRIAKQNGRVVTALDTRDTLPDDFAPVLVLDASGRVRGTYDLWERQRGGLVRLRSATKDYSNLTVHILYHGGGKDSWRKSEDRLLSEVATLIDTKPEEPWLVIHHVDACRGEFSKSLRPRLSTDASRISFLSWGRHQGTNDHAHIPNVVLAGTLFYPEGHYQGLTYLASGNPLDQDLPDELVKAIGIGEHSDLILQGLCRGSVRGSDGEKCRPCNAYIIASKGSGIHEALREVFPGCRVVEWKPTHKPLKGKVGDAVAYLEQRLSADLQALITFADLMQVTNCLNKANFNRTIRKHPDFVTATERLGLVEVATEGSRHPNALRRPFGPIPDATYHWDVQGSYT